MKNIRLLLWSVFRNLPNAVNEAPYHLSFWLLRLFLNRKIGYRNSLRYSCIEPFFSDLDITLVCEERFRSQALRKYQMAKKFLPLLGELNLYSIENFEVARANCNPFERDRDPLLQATFPALRSKAEKFVFAFRMLDADWDTLQSRPATRQRKWNCHFTCLGYPLMSYYDHDSVLKFLLSEIEAEHELSRVLHFKKRFAVNKATHTFGDHTHPVLQTVFFNHLCYTEPSADLSPLQMEVIAAQGRWEFWAAEITRAPHEDKQPHLGNVTKFLKNLHDEIKIPL